VNDLFQSFLEIVSQYGPFPVGIVFGVWISRWATKQQFEYMGKEIDALRKEREKIVDIVRSQESRIDILHNGSQKEGEK
jgi:hypothetical protein